MLLCFPGHCWTLTVLFLFFFQKEDGSVSDGDGRHRQHGSRGRHRHDHLPKHVHGQTRHCKCLALIEQLIWFTECPHSQYNTLSIMAFSITIFSKMEFCITTLEQWCKVEQNKHSQIWNNIWHSGTNHNDIEDYDTQLNDSGWQCLLSQVSQLCWVF